MTEDNTPSGRRWPIMLLAILAIFFAVAAYYVVSGPGAGNHFGPATQAALPPNQVQTKTIHQGATGL